MRTPNVVKRVLVLLAPFYFAACGGSSQHSMGSFDAGKTSGSKGDGGASTGTDGGAGESGTTSAGGVSISVSPAGIAIKEGAAQTYSCTVKGATNSACTWSVTEPGGGTISMASPTTAAYTAPMTTGTFHIVATSSANAGATATATVTVVAETVGNCSTLPAAGTWQNISPAALNMAQWCNPGANGCPGAGDRSGGQLGTYGSNAFVLDPNNPGTLYLGTSSLGFYKSTDCGSTWSHVDTGMNASIIDGGRNWSLVIDPTNSQVLYTVSGYFHGGVYKSTNGGIDWMQVLTQNVLNATGATSCSSSPDPMVCGQFGAFAEKITMDPTNNQHLLVSFHQDCAGTPPLPGATVDSSGGWGCLAESTDSGQTWSLTTSAVPWQGSDGPGQAMIDSTHWFYASNNCPGLWLTTTGGVSQDGGSAWQEVYNGCASGSVYQASNGVFISGGNNILWSSNGTGWTSLGGTPATNSLNGSIPIIDDGTTLYVGARNGYYTAPLTTSMNLTFTMISSTPVTSASAAVAGGDIPAYVGYDSVHHIFYSSNLVGGFWRYVTQ